MTDIQHETERPTLQAYLDKVYAESIRDAASLRTKMRKGSRTIEIEFQNFYMSFLQVWDMTRFKLNGNGASADIKTADEAIEIWINDYDHTAVGSNRWTADKAEEGLKLYNTWCKYLFVKEGVKFG
jgi:hypothetical protein